MKRTFLTLTLAAQLAAGAGFAQTSSGMTDAGMPAGTFGSDWSTTLSSAMFGEGGTTVRSESEIVTQWGTLSEDDRNMIRRDCSAYSQQSGDTTGETDAATATTDTATGTSGTAAGSSGTATVSTETVAVSTGSATESSETPTDSAGLAMDSTDTQPGSPGTQSGISDTAAEASEAHSSAMINVTMEQMEQICAATNDV